MLNIFEIWTVFIDFVNDDNLFRIVVIEMVLPTIGSYSAWVFLVVTLRLQCDFWSDTSHLDQFFQNRIDRRLTLSAGVSGAFNALPTCDSRAGHLANGLWGSLGDMKPFRPFIFG